MSTGHEHAFRPHVDTITAHCASGWLQLRTNLLAVLFLDLNNGQPRDSLSVRFLLLALGFGLGFRHAADHLKDCVLVETLIEIVHKVVRVYRVSVLGSHAHKLTPRENLHERA